VSVTPDCFEMTLLRSGNETNAKDCSSSSMATAILPVSDVGVVNADVSQTTGDLYLNYSLFTLTQSENFVRKKWRSSRTRLPPSFAS
jgi:hypothetical protein